jgi:hypothetical protein
MPSNKHSVRIPLRKQKLNRREELLKIKLKLDEKVIGLLVHSQGAIKSRCFEKDVADTTNIR